MANNKRSTLAAMSGVWMRVASLIQKRDNPMATTPGILIPDLSGALSSQKVSEMLDTISWAKDFSWQQMLLMGNYFKPYSIGAGLILFDEGSPGGSMGILINKCIEIYNKNKVIETLMPGRTYGEMSLIDRQTHSAKAIAREYSELLIIDHALFARLSEDYPRLAPIIILKIS
jgi:CRP-like cAMP-binding protein